MPDRFVQPDVWLSRATTEAARIPACGSAKRLFVIEAIRLEAERRGDAGAVERWMATVNLESMAAVFRSADTSPGAAHPSNQTATALWGLFGAFLAWLDARG